LDITPKNVLVFAVLLGGVAHIILFQDGYWHPFMWFSAALTVVIPVITHEYMKVRTLKNKRRKRVYADI
jgi:DMSO/TMAO reductase YedYZ heme-binding membrane subunit